MATISLEEVKYIAALAKIAISDDQAQQLRGELDTILGYVQQLEALDVTGTEPTYQVAGLTNIMRPDEIIDYHVDRTELLQNTPAQQDGQIKVPKVL